MTKHIPGPWEADSDGLIYREPWTDEADPHICAVNHRCEKHEANARLIAAAPELLEAAKVVASFAQGWEPLTPGDIKDLRDAIAKAEA